MESLNVGEKRSTLKIRCHLILQKKISCFTKLILNAVLGRLREFDSSSSSGNDAKRLVRALRSVMDEKADDKKSEKNYDFIRFGK